ncbi:Ribosomal-protein-alanine acetyltransferase [Candidatus Zixiibacteriota bacterium]|nr:Ribosomal-protein-alanine acetyltransferase [candidate division Zixibacteria bacterium]
MKERGKEEFLIKIRPMRPCDIAPITLIETRIFSDPWPMTAFEEELQRENGGFFVAESDGTVTGYIGYIIAAGEAQIINVGVAPEFQGKSIAKRLISHIFKIAEKEDCEYIFLDVRPSNTAAISLYRQFGFVELYRRPGYYRLPNEDAIVMVKNLREE